LIEPDYEKKREADCEGSKPRIVSIKSLKVFGTSRETTRSVTAKAKRHRLSFDPGNLMAAPAKFLVIADALVDQVFTDHLAYGEPEVSDD